MKTTANTTTTTVKVSQLALYLAIVAAMAFFNCLILRAGEPENDNSTVSPAECIKALTEEVAEVSLEIEDWMLNINQTYCAETEQQQFYGLSDADIRLEPWMTSEEESFVAFVEAEEEELRLESWMLNFDLIEGPGYYAEVAEEDLEIENWMLNICCWELTELLAENR